MKERKYQSDSSVFPTSDTGIQKEPEVEILIFSENSRELETFPWFWFKGWALISDEFIVEEYKGISHGNGLPR
ncbi:MAG: hypothetical protein WC087_01555 [Candidatus Paceibacterota bacterium]